MDESGESNFLIDGFPRNDENLNGWNASTLAEKVSYNYSYSFNTIGKSEGTYKVLELPNLKDRQLLVPKNG